VRRALAENLYEEETGGLAAGRPHPELFLEYPRGLGMDLGRFEKVALLPAARIYRDFLDQAIQRHGWEIAAAIVTIFIEGTKEDRAAIDLSAPRPAGAPLGEHPLVKHYGLDVSYLALTKAHQKVEGDHRAEAWNSILEFVPPAKREAVVSAMERALRHWILYRDQVAHACGIERDSDGKPKRASV
jgi:pyrroloquinoline-quinone synthase